MTDGEPHYPENFIRALEAVWGDGFLSPGGPEEIRVLIEGADIEDLSGQSVLDIGCGIGGIDLILVQDYGAEHVTAIDVEPQLTDAAASRIAAAGLSDRIETKLVQPGPLPFGAESFDCVFSKDAMLHIPDKAALYADVLRVLKPGGRLIAGDWLRGGEEDGPPPDVLADWAAATGLTADFATPVMTERALQAAGFEAVRVRDRNAWYLEELEKERLQVTGPGFQQLEAAIGMEDAIGRAESFKIRHRAVAEGALRPCHLYGRKPG
jgi:phosphoethanolamine N-methyltransferase